MLGQKDADHGESAPESAMRIIAKLACSLVGRQQAVAIAPNAAVHRFYGKTEVTEQFRCSYGLNPDYQALLGNGPLRVVGTDPEGEARIIELSGHPFFLATLFLPQLTSSPEAPHPLIVAFLRAAVAFEQEIL